MVKDVPNSTDQPDEIALTIYLHVSGVSSANSARGKSLETEDSFKWKGIFHRSVPNEKKRSTSEGTPRFPNGITEK